jgi:hypothetical protein
MHICCYTRSAKNYRLISCIASICHVYMKFPFKIKESTFFPQFWKNVGFWDVIQEMLSKNNI